MARPRLFPALSVLLILWTVIGVHNTLAFLPAHHYQRRPPSRVVVSAKPQRLSDNVDGVVYVNNKCIDCAACAGFAPQVFGSNAASTFHRVHHQPTTAAEIAQTRAALAACPVAAIRLETRAERQHAARVQQHSVDTLWSPQDEWTVQHMTAKERPFPRPFLQNETLSTTDGDRRVPHVYWTGHHNEASFGAIPYLVQAQHQGRTVWIMVDTPQFHVQSVRDVTSLTGPKGPDYLLLTHVDDTADHGKWAEQFPECRRIFHSGDLGRHNWLGDTTLEQVPILLPSVDAQSDQVLTAYTLDGDLLSQSDWRSQFIRGQLNTEVVVLHTPGHSPGSICLWKRGTGHNDAPGILFTGDTYAYDGDKMTGFGRYGNNARQQVHTLSLLQPLEWDIVAPGHGISRDYRGVSRAVKEAELQQAQEDLLTPRSVRS